MSISHITIEPDATEPTRARIYCRQGGRPNQAQLAIDLATAAALDALGKQHLVTGVTLYADGPDPDTRANDPAPWICTLKHDIALTGDLSGNAVDIHEIANALARINRYTGHTYANWSVAQHSLLVLNLAMRHESHLTPHQARALLLHDAHEAFTGDVASPIKAALGQAWYDFEAAHAAHVREKLGVAAALSADGDMVKHYDLRALRVERYRLIGRQGPRRAWPDIDGTGTTWSEPDPKDLDDMLILQSDLTNRRAASEAFLSTYHRLTTEALNGHPATLRAA